MRGFDYTGQKFGMLTAIKRVGTRRGIGGHARPEWLVKCDCGNEKIVVASALKRNNRNSCGCRNWNQLPDGVSAMNNIYAKIRGGARKRGHRWELTREQVEEIISKPCAYCGVLPYQISRGIGKKSKDYAYNGIDRVDNERGYEVGNVVPCCGNCNLAKHSRKVHDFKNWIVEVYGHWASKS